MATPRWITAAEVTQEEAGDVQGPDTAVDGNIALFDGTTGKLLKAAGVVEGVATIDATTNILIGDDAGNAVDSGVAISAIGGSFLSANTARVDSDGNDEAGTVGDLTKPFLTVQAALTALESSGLTFNQANPAVVLLPVVGIFDSVDLTTSLRYLAIVGPTLTRSNPDIAKLTLTTDGGPGTAYLTLSNVQVGELVANNLDPSLSSLRLVLDGAVLGGDCTISASLYITGQFSGGGAIGTIVPGVGKELHITGLSGDIGDRNDPTINAPGSDVFLIDSYISTITAAASISMQDSVVVTNNSGATPTVADLFMNPAKFDFSTLPTTEPTIVGKAWIDTTAGLNIVKVKL